MFLFFLRNSMINLVMFIGRSTSKSFPNPIIPILYNNDTVIINEDSCILVSVLQYSNCAKHKSKQQVCRARIKKHIK